MIGQGRKRVVLVLAAFVALAVGGCGGGDSTSALTKAQFIKQADAICKKADETQLNELGRVEQELTGNAASRKNQERLVTEGGLPPIQEEAEEIAALGAPSGDEDQVDAIVEAIEAGVVEGGEDPEKLESAFAEADRLAKAYGFKEKEGCEETL